MALWHKPAWPVWRTLGIAFIVAALFTLLIAVLSPALARFQKPEDQGPWWYYWQLAEPSFWSRLSAWSLYISHQMFLWVLCAGLIRAGAHHDRMLNLNYVALCGNLAFMGLHLIQTHVFYDGLAQDVPVWSSQWSVIIMLVLIIYLLIPRRGIFVGLKMPFGERLYRWIRKYHGYYMSWALAFTFWFHPMEGEYGLLTGFFYMFMLFMQISFAGTAVHRAMGWLIALELVVGIHGPAISIQKALAEGGADAFWQDGWPMFAFGFTAVFVFTGQFGFKMHWWQRGVIAGIWLVSAIIVYIWRGFGRIYEITFIPLSLIGGAALLALIGHLFFRDTKGRKGQIPVLKTDY
jgi:hypothetical protein